MTPRPRDRPGDPATPSCAGSREASQGRATAAVRWTQGAPRWACRASFPFLFTGPAGPEPCANRHRKPEAALRATGRAQNLSPTGRAIVLFASSFTLASVFEFHRHEAGNCDGEKELPEDRLQIGQA